MREPNTPTDGCLNGKVCVIIGGGSTASGWAIGQAVAYAYARAGAKVVVVDVVQAAADATAALIIAEGGSALACAADSTDEASIGAVIDKTIETFGQVSVLHNNVGIGRAGDSAQTTVDDWRRISDANLLSLHIASQAVIPAFKQAGGGVILCTSTIASLSFTGVPHLAYGVTKAAANHFCKLMAAEYAPFNIRANSIVVGMVDTPRIRKTLLGAYGGNEAEMVATRNKQIPLGFMGDAWDVANAAVFLASERARFVSGAELVLDGALSATTRV